MPRRGGTPIRMTPNESAPEEPRPEEARSEEARDAAIGIPAHGAEDLVPVVYEELRALAVGLMTASWNGATLQPTALVHEAFLRLAPISRGRWNDRKHFLCVAAIAMRQLLADHARARRALKRGGKALRVSLEEIDVEPEAEGVDIVHLDDALTRLAALNQRHARVVELRFLAGLTVDQTAQVLEVSTRTVETDWRFARAWLHRYLARGNAS